MSIENRRGRQRAQRHRLILDTAREIAEADGWDAVTTRRLAERIEYSQPVLYSHFANKDEIVEAVALDGFAELADLLRAEVARAVPDMVDEGRVVSAAEGRAALDALARAYLRFGAEHPALYAAMFTLRTGLRFAEPDSPEPLHTAFAALSDTLGAATGSRGLESRTEVFWSALHGLVSLGAARRLRAPHADERIELLVNGTLATAD
jgi:AcrR family transcriptional regulator